VVVAYQPWYGKELNAAEQSVMWNFGAGALYSGKVTEFYSHRLINELMQKVTEVSAEVAAAKGALVVDTPKLLEPGLHNYYDYMHFTPRGAGLIADMMNQVIRTGAPLDVAE
jgi:lysophospholipase L1-like esterase